MGQLLELCKDGENPLSSFTSGERDDTQNTKSGIADIIKQSLQLVIFMYSPYFSVCKYRNHWNSTLVWGLCKTHTDCRGLSVYKLSFLLSETLDKAYRLTSHKVSWRHYHPHLSQSVLLRKVFVQRMMRGVENQPVSDGLNNSFNLSSNITTCQ